MASGIIRNQITSNGYALEVHWSSKSTTSSNSSVVTAVIKLVCPYALYISARTDNTIVINGKTYYYNTSDINNDYGATYTLATITSDSITHNTDGTKSITITCNFKLNATLVNTQFWTITASSTVSLDNIPRYLSITSLEVTNITETSAVVKWSVSDPRTGTYYSFDNGTTWIGSATHGETLASDSKSGTFNILNLSANTTYNMKVKISRTDSGLWTESVVVAFTTYNYPQCTNSPNFTIGDALTLSIYNPLSRNITIKGYSENNVEIFSGTSNGTSITGFNDSNSVSVQYSTIPNSQSGKYRVVVSYGNSAITRNAGNTYSVRGNEVPTINGFDYIDNKQAVVNITGNNKYIVQNQSELLVRINAATPQYSAGSISQYYIECNGKKANGNNAGSYNLGTIDSSRDVNLTLTVVDSRGLSASKSITVSMLAHSAPTAAVTLQRLNNYEDETYLTIDGSVSSVNSKNTMTIKYRYKLSGGSYGSFVTIGDRAKQTLSLDKNNVYIFNVVITDAFGSKYDKEYELGKGVFPLFIDTVKNSVGINKFPAYDKSLEAWGLMSLGERQTFEIKVGESVEIPIWLALYSGLVNFRFSGANLEIARLFYVFRSNQYFGIHKTLVDESYNNTSSVVPTDVRNAENGYIFKFTNNHSSIIHVRYGIFELC